ncbi:hypothetical protein Afil01_15130 [Actinorhabdospora filicis]|uniref:Uncharacterized protein n=1 Tax=Actinorhabdospora filicis TaxID=1785913 RepID=A0A9W6SLB8_9ACTN|nr:hypothetical protein [Actinorhabdospora filicis]GLZ76706.1 hypothetical protein Afil01_15130 [Actinorhabdospora filicis]
MAKFHIANLTSTGPLAFGDNASITSDGEVTASGEGATVRVGKYELKARAGETVALRPDGTGYRRLADGSVKAVIDGQG